MRIELEALLAILGMAALTYATRVGGLWLMGRVTLSKRLETWLQYIPGSVLVAIVAPGVFSGGPLALIAALVTILVAARTSSLPLAMVTGVGALLLLRFLTGGI